MNVQGATLVSEQGLALIRRFEGFSPAVYRCPAGKRTIGYGHRLRPMETFTSITREQAEELLLADVVVAAAAVRWNVRIPLSQCQLDALTSFVYNIGSGAFSRSTLKKIVSRGWHSEVPAQLLRWVYIDGRPSNGLMARRQAEAELYMG